MSFQLPDLPYDYSALAPVIDEQTMKLHHDKHHQTYVDKLNEAIESDRSLQGRDLADLLRKASDLPSAVRNNGGGHWNHSFFWEAMTRPGRSEPRGELRDAIESKWDSVEKFQEEFNSAGVGRFGSGWVWLVATDDGLEITSTPNQDNPLMDVAEMRGTPILGNDVWEHAYYLTYQNRRADYLKAWWQVVDWNKASERLEAASRKELLVSV